MVEKKISGVTVLRCIKKIHQIYSLKGFYKVFIKAICNVILKITLIESSL